MSISPRWYLRLAIVFCAVIGLYDVLYVASLALHGPRLGRPQWVMYPDFLTPWAAVRAFFEGKLAMVYTDIDAFTGFQNALFADRFPDIVHYRPFLYPPFWLLALLPLGLIAVDAAYWVFMLVTAGASAFEGRRHRWPWGWLAMAVSPAAVHVVVSGQATFLAVALVYGGLRLLDRKTGAGRHPVRPAGLQAAVLPADPGGADRRPPVAGAGLGRGDRHRAGAGEPRGVRRRHLARLHRADARHQRGAHARTT